MRGERKEEREREKQRRVVRRGRKRDRDGSQLHAFVSRILGPSSLADAFVLERKSSVGDENKTNFGGNVGHVKYYRPAGRVVCSES